MIQDKHKTKAQLIDDLENLRQHLSTLDLEVAHRKQAEEALRENFALLAEAETLSSTGAWQWNIGEDTWHFSKEWLAIHGCHDRHLSSEELLPIAHSEDRERIAAAFEQVRTGSGPYDIEHRIIRQDTGEIRVIHARGKLVRDENGKPSKVLGAAQDITERKQVESSHEELRNLAKRLNTMREEERARTARELNDELGQLLAGLKMDLHGLVGILPPNPGARKRARSMLSLVDTAAEHLRELALWLRPAMLDDLGLVPAIEWQAGQFSVRTGVRCQLDLPDEEPTFDSKIVTSAFRILQEALSNVARHAEAKRVSISLEATDEGLLLVVRDDGKGITDAELVSSRSLGLIGMRERALALGGEVKVCRVVDGGTAVTFRC